MQPRKCGKPEVCLIEPQPQLHLYILIQLHNSVRYLRRHIRSPIPLLLASRPTVLGCAKEGNLLCTLREFFQNASITATGARQKDSVKSSPSFSQSFPGPPPTRAVSTQAAGQTSPVSVQDCSGVHDDKNGEVKVASFSSSTENERWKRMKPSHTSAPYLMPRCLGCPRCLARQGSFSDLSRACSRCLFSHCSIHHEVLSH